MAVSKLVEKPDGAKDVNSWTVNTVRDYRPYWYLGKLEDPGLYDPSPVEVHVCVTFHKNASAKDFTAKVIAMLPEAED